MKVLISIPDELFRSAKKASEEQMLTFSIFTAQSLKARLNGVVFPSLNAVKSIQKLKDISEDIDPESLCRYRIGREQDWLCEEKAEAGTNACKTHGKEPWSEYCLAQDAQGYGLLCEKEPENGGCLCKTHGGAKAWAAQRPRAL